MSRITLGLKDGVPSVEQGLSEYVTMQQGTTTVLVTRRIEVDILMMKLEIIMTTLARPDYIEDVKEIIGDSYQTFAHMRSVSALSWTCPAVDSLDSAHELCLRNALTALRRVLPSYQCWMIVTNRAVQPDTRISRYNGLWRSLANLGVQGTFREAMPETVQELDSGLRFFSALRVEEEDISLVRSIQSNAQTILVSYPSLIAPKLVQRMTHVGWTALERWPALGFIDMIVNTGGLLIEPFGEFDDDEAAIAVIARRDVIDYLYTELL
jgi:hypothetical protein